MALTYPDDAPLERVAAETYLVCPVNGCLIEDAERRLMNQGGRWVGAGETIDEDGTCTGVRAHREIAGYWIVGVMSPFLLHGIGGLAAARVKAQRALEAGEDDTSLREVLTKQWGIPYDPPGRIGSVDATALADRAEPGLRLGQVPEGVRFLTAAADVQGGRFEGLVRGWGEAGESWVVDHWSIVASPATSPGDWDDMIGRLLAPVPLSDGSGRAMRIHAAGFDSGGEAGVTTLAYQAWLRAKARGQARMRGRIDGRDAWTLLPLKGMSTPNAQRLAVVYPDSQRKDRRAGARGQVPTGQHNPNRFKDDLANQLANAAGGPWAVHVPHELRGDHLAVPRGGTDAPHRFFEQLTAEARNARGIWLNQRKARNEALDLMVMAHVMATLHGLLRLNWAAPRAWHAPWDVNSGVFVPDQITPPKVLTVAPAVPSVRAQPAAQSNATAAKRSFVTRLA